MIIPDQDICNRLLAVSPTSKEGGLLYNPDIACKNEQLSFIFKLIEDINPKSIVETGTGNAFFDYFVLLNFSDICIRTCDPWPYSQAAVNIVMEQLHTDHLSYYKLMSDDFFRILNTKGDLAWIDGDHSEEGCFKDLNNCYRIKIPNIIIDDYRLISNVKKAVQKFVDMKNYKILNESGLKDVRGIIHLVENGSR